MELLERARCLADLADWCAAASDRGGCVALVGGEAGIGKTALLHEFCGRQRAMRVLWGGCDDLLTPRPLAPLHDIARQAQGALLTAVGSGARRQAPMAASTRLLRIEFQRRSKGEVYCHQDLTDF